MFCVIIYLYQKRSFLRFSKLELPLIHISALYLKGLLLLNLFGDYGKMKALGDFIGDKMTYWAFYQDTNLMPFTDFG